MVGPGAIEKEPQSPDPKRWELMFRHIERDETLQDVVVSGGDTYTLSPRSLMLIGERYAIQLNILPSLTFAKTTQYSAYSPHTASI